MAIIIGNKSIIFKKQNKDKLEYHKSKNLKNSIIQALKDIKIHSKKKNSILL